MTVEATFHERPDISEARSQYYGRLAEKSARPLWEVLSSLVTPVPRDRTNAAIWRYREMRPLISEGARLITAATLGTTRLIDNLQI